MRAVVLCLYFMATFPVFAQFEIPADEKFSGVSFEERNNLIIVPVTLNGVTLNFIVDTGVAETLLFNLEGVPEISFDKAKPMIFKGWGSLKPVTAYRAADNHLQIGTLEDRSHIVFVVLDHTFDFSVQLGISVHGVIGYRLFKDFLVSVNYDKRSIRFYRHGRVPRFLKRYRRTPISIEHQKPYVLAQIEQQGTYKAKMLLDTGSSDDLWLFKDRVPNGLPQVHIPDFLGSGFSGPVYGHRARVEKLHVGNFSFSRPIAAFPELDSLAHIEWVPERKGSVGGGICSRFNLVFDYINGWLYLRPSKRFKQPFEYNMSGLEVGQSGGQWVFEPRRSDAKTANNIIGPGLPGMELVFAPVFTILEVRPGSAAQESGVVKGDVLIEINRKKANRMTIGKINALLRSQAGTKIRLKILRGTQTVDVTFRLQPLL